MLLGYNCLGSHFVLFPTAIVNTFGIRAGSQLYSIVYVGMGTQQITMMLVSYYLYQKMKADVYHYMFNIAVGLTLVSCCILFTF